MKNQYACDIGDYTKLGLLRSIQKTGLTLGVNWYLTPDDSRPDGKFVEYLAKPDDGSDPELFSTLGKLVAQEKRSTAALESSGLLGDAHFVNALLDYSQFPKSSGRQPYRSQWHLDALNALKPCDVVFLDPDNGLEVASAKPYSQNGNKYVTYEEAADYYKAGASIIVYNHRDRSPEQQYFERFLRFRVQDGTQSAALQIVRAFRVSVRDYVFLIQPRHFIVIQKCIDAMLQTPWGNHMKKVPLECATAQSTPGMANTCGACLSSQPVRTNHKNAQLVLTGTGGNYPLHDGFFTHNPHYMPLRTRYIPGSTPPVGKTLDLVGIGPHSDDKGTTHRPLVLVLQDPSTMQIYLVSAGDSTHFQDAGE